MDLNKVKKIENVLVQMRKGRKLLDSRSMSLDNIAASIATKLNTQKAILARHTLLEGETFKFKLNGMNFTVKPLLPQVTAEDLEGKLC